MAVELRSADAADAERVAEVLIASRKAFLPFAPSPHSDDHVRAWVRRTLLPSQAVTVALDEGRIAGVLAIARLGSVSWLTQLYLDPAYVARGIGSRLLAHAMVAAPRPIRLYCFQENHSARRFYERNGFVPVAFSDGSANEERCPDVLYELAA